MVCLWRGRDDLTRPTCVGATSFLRRKESGNATRPRLRGCDTEKMRCLRWFCFNTCGNVHALGIRGSVRRGQKFVDPFTLLDAQGGDGGTQLPDASPLAVAILHAVQASLLAVMACRICRICSRHETSCLTMTGGLSARSRASLALVAAKAASDAADHGIEGVRSSS